MPTSDLKWDVQPYNQNTKSFGPKTSFLVSQLSTYNAVSYSPARLAGMTKRDLIYACKLHGLATSPAGGNLPGGGSVVVPPTPTPTIGTPIPVSYKGLLTTAYQSGTSRSPSYSQGTLGSAIGGNGANAQNAVSFPNTLSVLSQIAPVAGTTLEVAFGAFFYGNDTPTAIPISGAAVEYPHASGNIYPLTFSGASSVTLNAGQVLVADPLVIPGGVTAGTEYNVRTSLAFVSPPTGAAWPSYGTFKSHDKGIASASAITPTVTTPYASITSSTSASYGPCGIFITGGSGATKSVAAVGDSIQQGVGDPTQPLNGVGDGYMHRALAGTGIGITNVSRHAERAVDWNTAQTKHRRGLAMTCQIAEVNYGINDIRVDNVSFPALQARLIAVWMDLAGGGLRVRQATITPNSTSTDGWTTVANQTIANAAQNTVRVSTNNWIRAGAPLDATTYAPAVLGAANSIVAGQIGHPLVGYRENADVLESSRDSGLWAVSSSATSYTNGDGLHPNAAGHALLAAAIPASSVS